MHTGQTILSLESRSYASSLQSLKARRLRRVLTSPRLHAELSHLLHRPPREIDGLLDAGTMCRESAVLVASIAARLGATVDICSGEAAIFGDAHRKRLDGHARHVSRDFRDGAFPGWRELPVRYLAGSRYFPGGVRSPAYHVRDPESFACTRRIYEASPPEFRATYLEQNRQPFDNVTFAGAVNFAQSPLIARLSHRDFFTLDLLGKAAVHVWRVLKQKAEPLTALDPDQSWSEIARIDSAAVEKFRLRLRLNDLSLA